MLHFIEFLYLMLYSFVFALFYKVRYPALNLKKTSFMRSRIKKGMNSNIRIEDSAIQNTRLYDNGKSSIVIIISSNLINCIVEIFGENNTVTIDNGSKIYNAHVVIKGSNCNFVVKQETAINGGDFVVMGENNEIVIGKRCMLAHNVNLWATDSHPIFDEKGNVVNPSCPIRLADHVWLGKGVCVLKGVTIGENSIVGMNSVVVKDIAPHTINVGNPSKPVKEVFNWEKDFIKE